jgi:hypothetical protein
VTRLSREARRRPEWLVVGTRDRIHALAADGATLYAIVGDAPESAFLGYREACAQNLSWRPVADADPADSRLAIVALASPRDAVAGAPAGLYALSADGALLARPATAEAAQWVPMGKTPADSRALAVASDQFFVLDGQGVIWRCPRTVLALGRDDWTEFDRHGDLKTLTGMNGRLYGIDGHGDLLSRSLIPAVTWWPVGEATGCTVLAGHAGLIYAAGPALPLLRISPNSPGHCAEV